MAETINLKILSPSTEVEGGVSFADIPTSTTIKELRDRIQDAVHSKPAPDRMRLIYRGRVVANDADTLGNVFGVESIRENKDQSLHLVLRELPPSSATSPSPAPRSSTAPPNPFRPAQAPIPASPPLQTNPFRTLPQPRPNSQPQVPPQHHHHHPPHFHHHHHHQPGPPNPFQMPLPPALQQHLAQTMGMAPNGQVNNGGGPNAQGQQPSDGTSTPANTTQAPPMGLPPLPGLGPPNMPPHGRTVRQEGIGPNGERWSVTISNVNVPMPPHQHVFPRPTDPAALNNLPPLPTPTEYVDDLLPHLRQILSNSRQELDNVRALLQETPAVSLLSANPPIWRYGRIRQHFRIVGQSLALVERGLDFISTDAHFRNRPDHPDWVSLRQSANEIRGHLNEVNRLMGELGITAPSDTPAPGTTQIITAPGAATSTTQPAQTQTATQTTTHTMPADAPEELFILSSPQGPVGVLFDQRGTYTMNPMVSTLPFQTFTNQFAQNRHLIAGLGQHMAQGNNHIHHQLANIQPTQPQRPAAGGLAQVQNQAQAIQQGQVQNPDPAQGVNANNPANPPANNDRINNIGGHIWLVFKLACFVYFFSGTGWYKAIALGIIAGGVYLAQLGIFEQQFNMIRQHFEALLPVGAIANRAAQPQNADDRAQRTGSTRNTTPEEMARRLLQQQRDQRFGWVRESMRTVERSFALFVASLWPGIGERMVRAQEERALVDREAEERQRQEEETRRQDAETQLEAGDKTVEVRNDENAGEGPALAKGKEKAEVADTPARPEDTPS